jgi:outer membrane lipoprotein-sorting protein
MRKEQGITENKLKDIDSAIKAKSMQFAQWCSYNGYTYRIDYEVWIKWPNKYTSEQLYYQFINDKSK